MSLSASSLFSSRFLSILLASAFLWTVSAHAQSTQDEQDQTGSVSQLPEQSARPEQGAPLSEEEAREQYAKSMTYMLRRAKLLRTLTAQHILHLGENADKPELHLVEEASQVIAFDLVCGNGGLDPEKLDQLATESTYRIAVEAGASPIVSTLTDLGREQSVRARMDLLGDVASSVFLFQVGRRRGLFDSLITDFGQENFCTGMQANMRERYDSLTSDDTPPPAEAGAEGAPG